MVTKKCSWLKRKQKFITSTLFLASVLSLAITNVYKTSNISINTAGTEDHNAIRKEDFPVLIGRMEDRMLPALLELLPEEISTIPVYDSNYSLVFGGKPLGSGRNPGKYNHCENSKLDDDRNWGRCCVGARSAGGDQTYLGAEDACHQNITIYRQVRDYAREDLNLYSVQFDKNNNPRNFPESHLRCDVCRIVQIVASMKHKSFAVAGDSVQHQMFTGLECELRRRNFNVTSIPKIKLPKKHDRLPVEKPVWKYGIEDKLCIKVTVPEWMKGVNPIHQNQSNHVEFCLYSHYRPYHDMEQHKKIGESSDVVMINYGLHYTSGQNAKFNESLEALFKTFYNSDSLLMYRETGAQHFDTIGGEYTTDKSKQKCVPMIGRSEWRAKSFEDAANRTGFSVVDSFQNRRKSADPKRKREVAFLPFWNFTSKLHSVKGSDADCTHFCYTPHLWNSMWRHIRIALDGYDRT